MYSQRMNYVLPLRVPPCCRIRFAAGNEMAIIGGTWQISSRPPITIGIKENRGNVSICAAMTKLRFVFKESGSLRSKVNCSCATSSYSHQFPRSQSRDASRAGESFPRATWTFLPRLRCGSWNRSFRLTHAELSLLMVKLLALSLHDDDDPYR